MWSLFARSSLSSFPYDILELVSEDECTIWKHHRGKRKNGGEEVSVFLCEGAGETTLDLAKAAVKRLKMFKHPSILKFVDSYESEKCVYLVTEAVTPLMKWLTELKMNSKYFSNIAGWGLLHITKGLSFMNNDGKFVHHNICSSSVYVTFGGEWKLTGLEYTTADIAYIPVKVLPHLSVYDPPELHSGNKRPSSNLWSLDIWGLGCLIWEVFNHHLDKNISLQNTSKIPKTLLPTYCELVGANPAARPNPKDVMDKLQKPGQFFNNDLIQTLNFLDEIQIKDDVEKSRFFSNLTGKLDNIPEFIAKNKILPALLNAHEYSNVGSVILTPLFKIGRILEEAEYQSQIVPCVVRMFSSTDRATRLKLLQQMETLADHLDQKTVNDQIFQPLITGFQDTNPTIREHTVKAILFLAPKLNHQNLNVEILKHFAKLQSRDDQGGIRTNTTVCLGKIASCLHPDTRQKCLVSAFTRAMRDPFPPARIAGVTATGATQQFYPLSDVASKIIPTMSHLTLDPEKAVRDAVFRVLKGFVGKLEKVSEDPELKEVMEKEVATASSSSTASSWAGWAVGALASKFYKPPNPQPQQSKENVVESSSTPSTRESSVASSSVAMESNESSSITKKVTQEAWDDDWQEQEVQMGTKTVSKAIADFGDSEAPGEGWDNDEEDWGSLEVEDSSHDDTSYKESASTGLPSASSYSWGNPSDQSDFFSSFERNKSGSKNQPHSSTAVKSVTTTNESSWNEWKTEAAEGSFLSNDKNDEQRKQREEKKLQRKKEIEAKRAARAGPMQLGTKKF